MLMETALISRLTSFWNLDTSPGLLWRASKAYFPLMSSKSCRIWCRQKAQDSINISILAACEISYFVAGKKYYCNSIVTTMIQCVINGSLFISCQEIGNVSRGPPPASRDEVAKLRIVQVTEAVLMCLGEDNQRAVCREALVVSELIQEMPCKHSYHPECLKPWLARHAFSPCPLCGMLRPN